MNKRIAAAIAATMMAFVPSPTVEDLIQIKSNSQYVEIKVNSAYDYQYNKLLEVNDEQVYFEGLIDNTLALLDFVPLNTTIIEETVLFSIKDAEELIQKILIGFYIKEEIYWYNIEFFRVGDLITFTIPDNLSPHLYEGSILATFSLKQN